jgi:hypothetical protein
LKHPVLEVSNDPAAEAHAVAAALGLPASFNPTLRPVNVEGSLTLQNIDSERSDMSVGHDSLSPDSRATSPGPMRKSMKSLRLESHVMSGDESSEGEDEEDGEFEVVAGHALLGNDDTRPEIVKKQKLHEMEVGEAAALAAGRKGSIGSGDSFGSGTGGVIDEEDEEEEAEEAPLVAEPK